MRQLDEADLVLIGEEAARAVVGVDGLKSVSVSMEPDSTGDPAYYFTFTLLSARGRRPDPGLTRMGLHRFLRDTLLARGDETYPFMFLRLDESTSAAA